MWMTPCFFNPPKKTSCFLFSRSARFHGSVWGPIASNSLLKNSPQIRWRDKNGLTVKGTVPDTFTYPSPSSARCFFSKKHPVQWREKLFEEKSGAFRSWWCFSTTWGYWLLLPLLSFLGIEFFFSAIRHWTKRLQVNHVPFFPEVALFFQSWREGLYQNMATEVDILRL